MPHGVQVKGHFESCPPKTKTPQHFPEHPTPALYSLQYFLELIIFKYKRLNQVIWINIIYHTYSDSK